MKIGDKLYCIKYRYSIELFKIYTIGESYEIKSITDNVVMVFADHSYYGPCKFIINGDSEKNYVIKDYFLTEQEYRKQKLEKLNEI